LDVFRLDADDALQALDSMCGRLATETGAFWSSAIGKRIDRRRRVDRELLGEINALEERLTLIPPAQRSPLPDEASEIRASRDLAQRLIGRCIFTSYLIDRGIAQPFLPSNLPADVGGMFANVDTAFNLFQWLRQTFNGDLFPMDDPGAEQERLGDAHLGLLRDFIEGTSLVAGRFGQGRLFRFRYDAIPVDLISAIYQQFARSSAADKAHVQGLHYTPIELVHLTLDPVFEGLQANARVIDPTCGSGAFLVEAFRRLVWRNTKGKAASRELVRRILYKQLFGIDINRSALGIAAFSLYLAALELDGEPVTAVGDLKFDHLIGTTLFKADTVHDELPAEITANSFDAVVGNPPWTFVRRDTPHAKRKAGDDATARPRRSPDQAFLSVAARLAGDLGRVGMIMKASPFFSKDNHAVEARAVLLRKLKPAALINLSALRKEGLFPDATGPALLFFARCALTGPADGILLGSVPWTPNFRRNGVFHIGPGELRTLPLARVLRTPAMLKAGSFGTARDSWLIDRLERSFPTLDDVLTKAGIPPDQRGQGFQVKGDPKPPPERYYKLKVLTPEVYTAFRLNREALELFAHPTLHRSREASLYRPPLLICPKGSFSNSAEPGRYSAAVSAKEVLYTESFFGVSFAGRDGSWAQVISAILNSSVATFQFAFSGGGWGLERPTVEPNDLLALRIPDLTASDPARVKAVMAAEESAAKDPHNLDLLGSLDEAVCDLYGLDGDEAVLAHESVIRARMLLFEGRKERQAFLKVPSSDALASYAAEVVHVVDAYLRARGKRHLEAVLYSQPIVAPANWADGCPGIAAVSFVITTGAPPAKPVVRRGDEGEMRRFATLLQNQVNAHVPPYLNERRQLRIYTENAVVILKPAEVRYWTRTVGLNDGDVLLADHWMKGAHASNR
jgi:hypothetical protein